MSPSGRCELCGRPVARTERHHLIPRTRHSNKRNKRMFDRAEVRERIAELCHPCHTMIHATLNEKELERQYNTLEALAAHPEIERFVRWLRKQPVGKKIRVRRGSSPRGRRP